MDKVILVVCYIGVAFLYFMERADKEDLATSLHNLCHEHDVNTPEGRTACEQKQVKFQAELEKLRAEQKIEKQCPPCPGFLWKDAVPFLPRPEFPIERVCQICDLYRGLVGHDDLRSHCVIELMKNGKYACRGVFSPLNLGCSEKLEAIEAFGLDDVGWPGNVVDYCPQCPQKSGRSSTIGHILP